MSNTAQELTPAQRIDAFAATNGITMTAEFVPFSKSRNAKEKSPSLNWCVTLHKNGRGILTTDYSQGCGHAPSYKASIKALGGRDSVMRDEAIRHECETGRVYSREFLGVDKRKVSPPSLHEVLYSLSMDSDAINYPAYESWAAEYGYDSDSRNGEAIYRACLVIALKLRAALGDGGLAALSEAGQDY